MLYYLHVASKTQEKEVQDIMNIPASCSCEYIKSTYNYNQMSFQRNTTGKNKIQDWKLN